MSPNELRLKSRCFKDLSFANDGLINFPAQVHRAPILVCIILRIRVVKIN